MVDPILNARLDALEQELFETSDAERWSQKLCLKKYELTESHPVYRDWLKFTIWVGEALDNQASTLRDVRDRLKAVEKQDDQEAQQVIAKAWTDYTGALERSQILFREFLEFVGGLILRDKEFDAEICDLADELVKSFSQLVISGSAISVPAARDSLASVVGSMVRVRFPEWTIWTLPFAANEYGHVVLNELSKIQEPINALVFKWLEADSDFQALPEPNQVIERNTGALKQRAECHVKVFLADIFATYLVGPAYACSAILLRLDPAGIPTRGSNYPNDTMRAHVVLQMLKSMNQTQKLYGWVIDYLETKWNAAQQGVNSGGLSADDRARLDQLVKGWQEFRPKFMNHARYPDTGRDGWATASTWAQQWSEQLAKPVGLTVPTEINHLSRLRDVLNAAWICRIRNSETEDGEGQMTREKITEVEVAARKLCNEILLRVAEQVFQQQSNRIKGIRV